MEPVPQPAPQPVPQPVPPPVPMPTPPPMPQPQPDPGSYEKGGILGQFDLVEIGFLIAGAFCIFHIIDYYRRKSKQDKEDVASIKQLQQGQEQLQMNFNAVMNSLRRRR